MVDLQSPPRRSPGLPPRRRPRPGVVALAVVIVAGLAAIGMLIAGADDEPTKTEPLGTTATSAPAPSPTSANPQAATKAEILAAYRQSFDAFVAVASDPNGKPTDPRLEEHTIGNALLAGQVAIDRLRKAGHVYQGSIELHPVVVELTGDTAVVEDCSIDRLGVVNAATGEVVTPIDTEPSGGLARATYKLINGVWMQNGFKDLKQPCVPAPS
jgi:hypothetical protein